MWLFLLFLAVPLIEIALFISVGGAIGLFPTLAIVIITAIVGTWLVKSQGGQVLRELQRAFNDVRDPSEPLAHGAMILFAGALLLTPGFFTDAVGFALLIPAFRQAVFAALLQRINISSGFQATGQGSYQRRTHPVTIDGEAFTVEDEADGSQSQNAGPSGWTKH